jgi:hypothetical protein
MECSGDFIEPTNMKQIGLLKEREIHSNKNCEQAKSFLCITPPFVLSILSSDADRIKQLPLHILPTTTVTFPLTRNIAATDITRTVAVAIRVYSD